MRQSDNDGRTLRRRRRLDRHRDDRRVGGVGTAGVLAHARHGDGARGVAEVPSTSGESEGGRMRWPRVVQHADEAWMPDGACRLPENRSVDFFPATQHTPTGRPRAERYTRASATDAENRAREVCESCPVMDECRDYALATRQEAGVWGGLTEEERRSRRWRRWWRERQLLQRGEDGR